MSIQSTQFTAIADVDLHAAVGGHAWGDRYWALSCLGWDPDWSPDGQWIARMGEF